MTDPNDHAFGSGNYDGLTKREYFAGQAMGSILAGLTKHPTDWSIVAYISVQLADALIAELSKEKK